MLLTMPREMIVRSRQVEWTASEGTTRYWMYRTILDMALIPDAMVIPGSSCLLQMVDHTLIDVP